MYEGRYKKGLGKGGRARLINAKKSGGYVSYKQGGAIKTYNFGKNARRSLANDPPELKFLDTTITIPFPITGACSTSSATGNIHIIPQGDTESSREGRQVHIKSIQLRGVFTFAPAAGATASTAIFLVLLLDTQANGANPNITDVFTSNAMRDNMLNLSNNKRFKIIKRWKYTFVSQAGATTAYNNVTKIIDWYKQCDVVINYDNTANTGAVTTTRQNNILMAYGSDVTAGTVTLNGAVRIRFTG